MTRTTARRVGIALGVLALVISGAACGPAATTPTTAAPTTTPTTTTPPTTVSPEPSAAVVRFCNTNFVWSKGLFSLSSFNDVWLDEVPQTTELLNDAVTALKAGARWVRTDMRNLMLAYREGNFLLTEQRSIVIGRSCIKTLGTKWANSVQVTTSTTTAPPGPSAAVVTFCRTFLTWSKDLNAEVSTGTLAANWNSLSDALEEQGQLTGAPFGPKTAAMVNAAAAGNMNLVLTDSIAIGQLCINVGQ
jgi:hypothetical protein